MRVLVTNDDGVSAPGMQVLAERLADHGHDVIVAAPASDRSGSGTAIGLTDEGTVLEYRSAEIAGRPDVVAFAVDAPPALIVIASCSGMFGPPPEIVVSGINPGWNTGVTILHSGTVGAALTAAAMRRSALAISCGPLPGSRFDTAADVAVHALGWLHERPAGTVLNVNVPDVDLDQARGIVEVPLSRSGVHGVRLSHVPTGMLMTPRQHTHAVTDATDSAAVLAGCIALTGLRVGPSAVAADGAATFLIDRLGVPEGGRSTLSGASATTP